MWKSLWTIGVVQTPYQGISPVPITLRTAMLATVGIFSIALITLQASAPMPDPTVGLSFWQMAERGGAWGLLLVTLWCYRNDVGALAKASTDAHRESAIALTRVNETLANVLALIRERREK